MLNDITKEKSLSLLYRASEHGFKSKSYHEHVDGVQDTITFVKSENNGIFGIILS